MAKSILVIILLADRRELSATGAFRLVSDAFNINIWKKVVSDEISASDYRQTYVTAHAVFIKALGKAGRVLFERYGEDAITKIGTLRNCNLRKDNNDLQGIIMHGKRINGAAVSIEPLANYILMKMGEEPIC